MKCVAKVSPQLFPVGLSLFIEGAPHRRQHREVLQRYRECILAAVRLTGLSLPIAEPIDLYVSFSNPASPDLDNLLTALYRALDAKSLKGPSVLEDDALISKLVALKLYTGGKKK